MSNARNLSNLLGTGTTIATAKIADDAITSAKIADDAVVSAAIADDAVVSAAIADNAVDTAQLAADAVDNTILDLASDFAGIHFGGTGSDNQFDDYETGTWTSTITYDNTVTDTSPDQTLTVTGAYVKSGDMCLAVLPTINRTSTFSGSNAIVNKFSLPFTAGSTYVNGTASFEFYNVRGRYGSTVMTQGALTGQVGSGSSNCSIIFHGWLTNGGGYATFENSASRLNTSVVYRTA